MVDFKKLPTEHLPLKVIAKGGWGQYIITCKHPFDAVVERKYAGQIVGKSLSHYVVNSANMMPAAIELLKESINFMNLVPNNKHGDNYELCSRIDEFLKELE